MGTLAIGTDVPLSIQKAFYELKKKGICSSFVQVVHMNMLHNFFNNMLMALLQVMDAILFIEIRFYEMNR